MTRGARWCQPHRVTSGCQTVRMRRGWGVLGVVAITAVTAVGCGSGSHSGVGGTGGGKVYTTSPIDVKAGDDFTISLEANPSTGYSWELTGPLDDKVVVELGSDHEPGTGTGVGVPGHQLFRFQAVGAGSATIGLQYVRPWETGVAPAQTSEFTVNVS